jgi:hypothetical protein
MKRLLLLVLLLIALPAPAYADTPAPQVVVVGVPGLRWSDVTSAGTPALARLARVAAVGLLSVKTAAPLDCPADGWLTLGAGNRVRAAGRRPHPCGAALPTADSLPEQVRANAERREGAEPGLLARTLERRGGCVTAVGAGAALAAADPAGSVAPDRRGPSGSCPVRIVEAPAVAGPDRAAGARLADAVVADELARLRQGATLLVLGVSEAPGGGSPHLHVALATGQGFPRGGLSSPSTRRAPYVQLIDVAPTVLSLLGIPAPVRMAGQPWHVTGPAPGVADLRDEAAKAAAQRSATVPFFVVLVGVQLLLIGVGLLRRWWRLVELVALWGVCAMGASYLANLVPWWRAPQPPAALVGTVAVIAAVLTAGSLLVHARMARAGLACALTAGVIVVDLLTGAHLQMSSVAGYSPLVAGRFAGIGNVAFGVLAAAALLAAASTRSATVATLMGLVVVVDGAPQWGSDVGGVLALVPAFALLVLLLAGRTVNLARLALATLAGVLVVTAFAIADHARPAQQQTHLGRFVGQVVDGTAGGVIRRKAEANLGLLFHSPVTALLPLVVAFLLLLFLRSQALHASFATSPQWRAGLLAVLTASGIGFVVNDSGTAVVALAVVVALPATLAVLARHAREESPAG